MLPGVGGVDLIKILRKRSRAGLLVVSGATFAHAGHGKKSALGLHPQFPWIREVRLVVAGDFAIDDNGRGYTYADVEAKDLVLDPEALALSAAGADQSEEVLLEQIEDWLDDFSWEIYEGFGGDEHELVDVVIQLQRSLLSELPVEHARSGGRLADLLDERGLISIGGDPVTS